MMIYGRDDKAIFATLGEPFAIDLEVNYGTGATWQFQLDGQAVRLVKTEHVHPGSGFGGGGVDRFTFDTVAVGEARIIGKLKRGATVFDQVTFDVSVAAAP